MVMARPMRATIALVLVVVVAVGLTTGLAAGVGAEPPEFLRSFGPDGTSSGSFQKARSVAVDPVSGFVYVLAAGSGAILKFDLDGQPTDFSGSAAYLSQNELAGLSINPLSGASQVAVDATTHKIYVTDGEGKRLKAFEESGEPALFSAGSGAGTNEIGGFEVENPSTHEQEGTLFGVAVDENGDIYAADHRGTVKVFAPSGEPLTEFSAPSPGNLAVDSNGVAYVNRFVVQTGDLRKFVPSETIPTSSTTYAEASAPFEPHDSTSVAVDPTNNDVYVALSEFGGSALAWYDPNGSLLATISGPSEDAGATVLGPDGVAVDPTTKRIFVIAAEEEEFHPLTRVAIFKPKEIKEGPPTVETTSVSNVSATDASLHAAINPNTFETSYWFEYGTSDCSMSACAAVPIGGAAIGSGHEAVVVSQEISGLTPNMTYHYRVVAINHCNGGNPTEECRVEGPDRTFTTQLISFNFKLADHRAWEMVSPPDKFGAKLSSSALGLIQAAADGDGLAYLSRGSIEKEVQGNRSLEASSVLARRTANGWESKDISPPHNVVVPLAQGEAGEYRLFNSDLTRGLFRQRDDAPLSPTASERTPYIRQNTEPPVYTPLVTGREGVANVPPGTQFGGELNRPSAGVNIAGATPDLSSVVLHSEVPLAVGAPPSALYEWTGGQLKPVSVLPESEGGAVIEAASIGSGRASTRHAISRDGRLVFWSRPGVGVPFSALYLRDTVGGATVRIDSAQAGASGGGPPRPIFQNASSDGSVVFFTDRQHLTTDASPVGDDLYRCEIALADPSAGCASLTNLTGPQAGFGESADVQGLIPALSTDGKTLYFVAGGVLDSGSNDAGEVAAPKQPNLYRWQDNKGFKFIATLSNEDAQDWGVLGGNLEDFRVGGVTAAGSPSGRYLSFMSVRSLTGYDNHDAASGQLAEEVFLYDGSSDQLKCVSCNPSGGSPRAVVDELLHGIRAPLYDPRALWEGRTLAAAVPESTISGIGGPSFYQPRYVLDSGRVFFNSVDPLVPADSNGNWDIYEYESTGTGDCSTASSGAAVSRSAGGCVSLVSSGTGEEEAGFLDASESGDDVFFLTPAQLNEPDQDQEYDAYDARVDGVPATLPSTAECLGEACQANPVAPNDPTPASASLQGKGNVKTARHNKRCAKGKHRVRQGGKTQCVQRKYRHRKHGAGKHGKTGGAR